MFQFLYRDTDIIYIIKIVLITTPFIRRILVIILILN